MNRKEMLLNTEMLAKKTEWCSQEVQLLTCPLCYGIVREPAECMQCDTLFCRDHAEKWIREKGTCPSCKMKPWRIKQRVHKAYQILLDKLRFDCMCGEIVAYGEIGRHGLWQHLRFSNRTEQNNAGEPKEGWFQQRKSSSRQMTRKTSRVKETALQVEDSSQTLSKGESSARTIPRSPASVPPGVKFIFSYLIGDTWYFFDRKYNKQLNAALPRSKFTIDNGDQRKKFDLTGMVMKDELMDYQLRVEPYTGFIWRCYIKQDKAYVGYPRDLNARINEQYELGNGSGSMLIFCHRGEYLLDFQAMLQINQHTHYQRQLLRSQY